MRSTISCIAFLCLFVASTGLAQEKKKDDPKSAYYGTWNYKTGVKGGTESTEDMLAGDITIDDNAFTLPGGPDMSFVMKYEIDFEQDPAQIDFEIESGPIPDGAAKGIIKIKDGLITLCYHPTGGDRPSKFESTEENGCHLFTMTKAKSSFDAASLVGDWSYISGTRAGEDASEENMSSGISIDKDKITIPVPEDSDFIFSYEVDAETNPIAIDITIEEGPQPGAIAKGIIKMEDGKFTLCYNPMGDNRPEKFESTSENGFFLFVLEKDD